MKRLQFVVPAFLMFALSSCIKGECHICTASPKAGTASSVSDEVCSDGGQLLTELEKETFENSFSAMHDTSLYNISCITELK